MSMRSEEAHGFAQPFASVTFTLLRMSRFVLARFAQVGDGGAKGVQELVQGDIRCRESTITVQPAASLTKRT